MTIDAVVSTQEVGSEVMQQSVQVGRLVAALFTAVNTLTPLEHRNRYESDCCRTSQLSTVSALDRLGFIKNQTPSAQIAEKQDNKRAS